MMNRYLLIQAGAFLYSESLFSIENYITYLSPISDGRQGKMKGQNTGRC